MKVKLEKQMLDNMSKDPGNWRGPFYFNRKDPRVLVPKLNPSMGWTINFANPYAYIVIGISLVIIVVIKFVSK